MAKQFFGSLVCVMAVLLVGRAVALAQTPAGDLLKGQGAYLKGLGSYNLNTAQAGSINVDSMIRWKSDLRKIQRERWNREAELAAGKQAKKEDVLRKLLEREQQLRVAATIDDVLKGDALNVLVYDLTDPDIKQNDWSSKTVSLPPGTSVKDLIFRFTPQSKQGAGATALSKGVIALSRLDIKGKWPTFMNIPALDSAKGAYENAYLKVRDEILADKSPLNSLLAMDRTLDALKDKVKEAVPTERDYRAQGLKFVDDLKAATRMFDAGTVDYAKDILTDTKNGDATTVAELVSFMLKYRLQFTTSDRSPAATELYPKLYQALQQQAKELGIKPPELPEGPVVAAGFTPLFNGKDMAGWSTLGNGAKNWAIENNAVASNGAGGWLLTDREYDNFELRCEYRLATKAANSGIAIRTPASGDPAFAGMEIQLLDEAGHQGKLRDDQRTGAIYGVLGPRANTNKPLGEWNDFRIVCQGRKVTVEQNGKLLVTTNLEDHHDKFAKFPGLKRSTGRIGLQSHTGRIEFRNISIKELK